MLGGALLGRVTRRKAVWQRAVRPLSSSLSDLQRSIDPAHLQVEIDRFPPLDPPPTKHIDPFKLVEPDLRPLSESLKDLVGVDHPVLNKVARHFFDMQGKRFRPTILLLVSQALGAARDSPTFAKQKRLAEVTEMIHTASLIHDDVIDVSDMRRGARTVHKIFGNKVAVLAGDFLLARASVLLAKLGDTRVVELVATVLEDMVHGEMMQARAEPADLLTFEHYILKNYLKTGSLISLGCQAAGVLAGDTPDGPRALAARDYGRHLGVAYQVVDDLLDFTSSDAQLGKPALADMASGLATAPALFAARQFPEMATLIKRQFSQETDLEAAYDFVQRSDGLAQSRRLAEVHMQIAISTVHAMPGKDEDVKGALVQLCYDTARDVQRAHNPACAPEGSSTKIGWREKNPQCAPEGTSTKIGWLDTLPKGRRTGKTGLGKAVANLAVLIENVYPPPQEDNGHVDTTGINKETGQAQLQMFGSKTMNVGNYKGDTRQARHMLDEFKRAVNAAKAKADRAGSTPTFLTPKEETEETPIAAAATLVYEQIVKPEGQAEKRFRY